MLYPGVKKLAKARAFKRTENEAVGAVQNCYVRLSDGNNLKNLIVHAPVSQLSGNDTQEITRLCAEVYKIKAKDVLFGDNLVKVVFHEFFVPYSMKKIEAVLDAIVSYFARTYPEKLLQCGNCAMEGDIDLYTNGREAFLLCRSCAAATQTRQAEELRVWTDAPNNYLAAGIASFVCTLPGLLLSAAIFVFAERVSALCALAYIFLAVKGYRALHGKTSRVGALIVNGIAFLMTGIGAALGYTVSLFMLIKSFAETSSFGDLVLLTLETLKNAEVQAEMLLNIVLALVVSAACIVVNVWQMVKEWSAAPNLRRAWNFGEKPVL